MLFNDGRTTTTEDLRQYESTILDVAATEGIELDKKINLATREIGTQLLRFLVNYAAPVMPTQMSTGLSGDTVIRNLDAVVVTDPLRQWHTLHTLALIFRDAYNSQLNNRYEGKWQTYAGLADEACDALFDIGVGMSNDAMPVADDPVCSSVNGGVLPSYRYTVQAAWESAAGNIGGLSDPVVFTADAGQLLVVDAGTAPAGAAGWNVYVGNDLIPVSRQNNTRLKTGAVWECPVDGLIPGSEPPADAPPDYYVMRRRGFRG